MSELLDIVARNAPGPYYVTHDCIDCDTCRCIATALFERCDDGYSFVRRQPVTTEEWELMEEAKDCCPVNAIQKSPSHTIASCGETS